MPVIRITDATWERMKKHARPLEDTPEDIVRRALDALEGRETKPEAKRRMGRPSKRDSEEKLPQKELREPLLLTLHNLGGSASLTEVRQAMLPRINGRLNPADHEPVSNGDPRWWNATCWERSDLVKEGLLSSSSPRGVWTLSDLGKAEAAAIQADFERT